jgi:hypothetical protein
MIKNSILGLLLALVGLVAGCGDTTSDVSANKSPSITAEITEVATPTHLLTMPKMACAQPPKAFAGPIDIATIINIGKLAWEIIKENRAVVNTCVDYANALPKGVTDATQLAGFSQLQFKTYNYLAKNALGGTLADITYTVVHQYGGTLAGQGKFLSTVSVIPSKIRVTWGNRVDFQTTKVAVTNVGTDTEPVASIVMETQIELSNVFDKLHKTQVFQINGSSPDVMEIML